MDAPRAMDTQSAKQTANRDLFIIDRCVEVLYGKTTLRGNAAVFIASLCNAVAGISILCVNYHGGWD